MLNKFNCIDIITSHSKTLKDFNQNKILKSEVGFFYGFPLFFAILGNLYLRPDLDKIEPVAISVYAIFIPLLLNLLLFNLAEIRKYADDKIYSGFLIEIHHNVSFSVLISILGITLSITDLLVSNRLLFSYQVWAFHLACTMDNIFFFCLIYIGTLFFLSLFMILRRVHVLLEGNNHV